jgi:hypothetical protein
MKMAKCMQMKAFCAPKVKPEIKSPKNKMSAQVMGINVETSKSGAKAN